LNNYRFVTIIKPPLVGGFFIIKRGDKAMRCLYSVLVMFGLVNIVSAEEEKVEHNMVEYVQELTGKLDTLTQTIEGLEKRIEILESACHAQAVEEKNKAVEKVATEPKSAAAAEKPKRSKPSASADSLWGDGMAALQHKNYDEAAQKLGDLVQFYPEHSAVPEACYWLGEICVINKKYAQAQTYYAPAYKAFPETNLKKAEVGLKIAECYFALNKNKEGCLFLKEIMKLQQRGANISSATLQLMQKYWVQHKCDR
jgi:TolA-binding protein